MWQIKIIKHCRQKERQIKQRFCRNVRMNSSSKLLHWELQRPQSEAFASCCVSCPFHRWVESSYLTLHSAFNWHPICIAENRRGGQRDVYVVANEVAWRVLGWILAKQPPPCTHCLPPVTATPHPQHNDECTHSKSSQILLPVTIVRSA